MAKDKKTVEEVVKTEQPEEKAETESPAESTDEAVEFEWQQYWDPMAHSFKKRLVPKKK